MGLWLLVLILLNEGAIVLGLSRIVRALTLMSQSLARTERMTARILTHFPETGVQQ